MTGVLNARRRAGPAEHRVLNPIVMPSMPLAASASLGGDGATVRASGTSARIRHSRPQTAGHHRTQRRSAFDHVRAGQGPIWLVCRVKDSNLGRRTPTDLQSVAAPILQVIMWYMNEA